MTAIVCRGNAADLHLADESVDLIVTSPPYFGLRSYQDGGEHYEGQIGDEATPTEYLDALIAATAEWVRVLKPGGSIFVNLGDKYSSGNSGQRMSKGRGEGGTGGSVHNVAQASIAGLPTKTLVGLPWRYAIRCIDELGLILRAEIVWSKPNGLPESVTDRVRRSHEQVFHFTKSPRYYSAVDEVRETYAPASLERNRYGRNAHAPSTYVETTRPFAREGTPDDYSGNPLGKLPGSVWTIPTAPLKVPDHLGVDHFAAYPPELVRRIVLGWSPREVCTACGEGRRPVYERPETPDEVRRLYDRKSSFKDTYKGLGGQKHQDWLNANPKERTGYACACPDTTAPTTPGVVLDPFGGTGTTALVASCYGRVGISVDLSADYCRLAQWRTTDPGERARVLGVEKPPVQVDGQLGLFEGGAA